MLCDFHTHTLLSDGVLSPVEMIRRAKCQGYDAIGLTDHVGAGYLSRLIAEIKTDCALAAGSWDIEVFPGVEITHAPAKAIAGIAKKARGHGAVLVVVHGQTIVEPVDEGTDLAAVKCNQVDILAHPGLITLEEAKLAAKNEVFLEISARKGHSLTNGHVVKMARLAGARLLVDSDAHSEDDLLTAERARKIAIGAGVEPDELQQVLENNPRVLLERLRLRATTQSA